MGSTYTFQYIVSREDGAKFSVSHGKLSQSSFHGQIASNWRVLHGMESLFGGVPCTPARNVEILRQHRDRRDACVLFKKNTVIARGKIMVPHWRLRFSRQYYDGSRIIQTAVLPVTTNWHHQYATQRTVMKVTLLYLLSSLFSSFFSDLSTMYSIFHFIYFGFFYFHHYYYYFCECIAHQDKILGFVIRQTSTQQLDLYLLIYIVYYRRDFLPNACQCDHYFLLRRIKI